MRCSSFVAIVTSIMLSGLISLQAQETETQQADAEPATTPQQAAQQIVSAALNEARAALSAQAEGDRALGDRPIDGERQRLNLMLTGNIDGNLARVNCRHEGGYRDLYWTRHAAHYWALEEASNDETGAPVALNVGNSVFPGALGRYLMTRDGTDQLAQILAEVPLQVHGMGHREFAAPRSALVDFLEAMEEQQIDMQAANLECEAFEGAEAICDSLQNEVPYRVIERQDLRIGVASVIAEERFQSVAVAARQGLRLLDPKQVLPDLVAQMREDVDLVIIQHQVPRREATSLAYELGSEVDGIDLLIASHLIDATGEELQAGPRQPMKAGRMAVIKAASTGTAIISADSTQRSVIDVELDLKNQDDDDSRWTLRKVFANRVLLDELPHHPPTKELLEAAVESFCADWGDALGEYSRLDEPLEMEDLQQFILNVMRFSTHSELALSNRGAFRNEEQFPLTDHLTTADIHATLPYENRLVTADIDGSVLRELGEQLDGDLIGAGISVKDGDVLVNGRTPREDRSYRVALNQFIAQGGDDLLDPDDLANTSPHHPAWSQTPPTIGDLVIEYVRSGEHLERGKVRDAVAARDNFPDLHRKFLWEFLSSLNASYNQVMVENPLVNDTPGYDQGQLTVQSTDQINLEGRLAANADSRDHGWNNDLTLQYATARISDEDAGFEETSDQIRLRSRYRYKRLRVAQEGSWYIPDPVVEGQLESEFRRPDAREWHRLDLRAIAGASFQLADPLDVRIGANIRQDINEPDGEATYGLNLSYTLERINLLRIADRPVRFESEVEYFFNDIGDQNIHEARSRNRLYFAMFNQFFFTTTFNAFLYRDDTVGELGSNTELTIGINYEWEMSRQRF